MGTFFKREEKGGGFGFHHDYIRLIALKRTEGIVLLGARIKFECAVTKNVSSKSCVVNLQTNHRIERMAVEGSLHNYPKVPGWCFCALSGERLLIKL
jgi:hypothetical protein